MDAIKYILLFILIVIIVLKCNFNNNNNNNSGYEYFEDCYNDYKAWHSCTRSSLNHCEVNKKNE